MKKWMILMSAIALLFLFLLWMYFPLHSRTMSNDFLPSAAPVWSHPIHGLSGRLRVEFEDLNPGLRHALYLELKNQTPHPLAVTTLPQVDGALVDRAGIPVAPVGYPQSGPQPIAQWAVIPCEAYLGFRIDGQTIGMPTREQGRVLLAVGGQSWGLSPGTYRLAVTVRYTAAADAPQPQWTGALTLPPTLIEISSTLFNS